MFTGIVEEIGTITGIRRGNRSITLSVQAREVLKGTKRGDSISTNGVCLTVTSLSEQGFTADVMPQTLRETSLAELAVGSRVNLERAMTADGRFGGHIVSGHVDGVGHVLRFEREDNAIWMTIRPEGNLMRYILEKGSVALDGVSLTVAVLESDTFRVSLIPATADETILTGKRPGSLVNIECDIIGKYVERLLGSTRQTTGITLDRLMNNGFM